jgi:hypothetical protein
MGEVIWGGGDEESYIMSGMHGKMRNAYKDLVRKPEGMKPLESHGYSIT